ncbi:hypothetical protein HNQ73_003495 [Chelatococcus composti]|mgnify:FL=1|jgi:hypothetical protein|uniref:Uncharacterized protein n=1 Tax=Chelatococcus composti TaxID=1743235 RepID=A0A841KET8_9HYPH|nr:hypothetical protein [Chelatococcus composti]
MSRLVKALLVIACAIIITAALLCAAVMVLFAQWVP